MQTEEVFDRLGRVYDIVRARIVKERLGVVLTDSSFRLSWVGNDGSRRVYSANLVVGTAFGVEVPLFHYFIEDDLDETRLAWDAIATIIEIADASGAGPDCAKLLGTIEERFALARSEGVPLSMLSLRVQPIPIGVPGASILYELTSWFLGSNGSRESFVMQIADYEEFERCFAGEILPEQRARAVRHDRR